MCLLTYFSPGTQPDTKALLTGSENNPDGNGYAIIIGGEIVVRKSMNAQKLIEEFENLRRRHPDNAAMFHSRIGTGGLVDTKNCHPFRVGGDARTVVGHNGVLPANMQPSKKDPRCDTRIFADTHLPYRNLNSAKSRRKLGKWIGTDKLCILTVNPLYDQQAYLINESQGHWSSDGVWYSNSSYEDWYGSYYEWSAGFYAKCASEKLGIHYHYAQWAQQECGCDVVWEAVSNRPTGRETYTLGYPFEGDSGYEGYGCTAPAPTGSRERLGAELATRDTTGTCIGCASIGRVSTVTLICSLCYTCQDCGGTADHYQMSEQDTPCQCHIPAAVRLSADRAAALDDDDDGTMDPETMDRAIASIFGEDEVAALDARSAIEAGEAGEWSAILKEWDMGTGEGVTQT